MLKVAADPRTSVSLAATWGAVFSTRSTNCKGDNAAQDELAAELMFNTVQTRQALFWEERPKSTRQSTSQRKLKST